MSYTLKEVTIRTNNTDEGMKKIAELWDDIKSGNIPVLFDNMYRFQQGVSPVSRYSNYASDENGDYDLSIIGVTSDFFKQIELKVSQGLYKKYETYDNLGRIEICTKMAWEKVWNDERQKKIARAFTEDYESSVPAHYTKDGKAHCYLYIALKK